MIVAIALVFCHYASAATIIVTNTADSGTGSLRQALLDAQNGDTIIFNIPGSPNTVTLTSSELVIDIGDVAGHNMKNAERRGILTSRNGENSRAGSANRDVLVASQRQALREFDYLTSNDCCAAGVFREADPPI